jgi:hypothetical protein
VLFPLNFNRLESGRKGVATPITHKRPPPRSRAWQSRSHSVCCVPDRGGFSSSTSPLQWQSLEQFSFAPRDRRLPTPSRRSQQSQSTATTPAQEWVGRPSAKSPDLTVRVAAITPQCPAVVFHTALVFAAFPVKASPCETVLLSRAIKDALDPSHNVSPTCALSCDGECDIKPGGKLNGKTN